MSDLSVSARSAVLRMGTFFFSVGIALISLNLILLDANHWQGVEQWKLVVTSTCYGGLVGFGLAFFFLLRHVSPKHREEISALP